MNYNLRQLIKYCQLCGSRTKCIFGYTIVKEYNLLRKDYYCTSNCTKNVVARTGDSFYYISDGANDHTFTIFIFKKDKSYILIDDKKIYFDSVSDLIKYYKQYKKNKIFR